MPYRHAGEIGDVWKHLVLCELLSSDAPARYFETNAAYPYYPLKEGAPSDYGVVFYLTHLQGALRECAYTVLLTENEFLKNRVYYGSGAQAMQLLGYQRTAFYYFDIEPPALQAFDAYANRLFLRRRLHTQCADAVAPLLSDAYSFSADDFVHIDPDSPFDSNAAQQNFFSVFEKACVAGAKTLLWYGFDSFQTRDAIRAELFRLGRTSGAQLSSFELWQRSMTGNDCAVNPGVPGCGVALGNIAPEDAARISTLHTSLAAIYENARYGGASAAFDVQALVF